MIDKKLLALVQGQRKYIVYTVFLNIGSLFASLCVTAGICLALHLAVAGGGGNYWVPFFLMAAGAAVRYCLTVKSGDIKTRLGNAVKSGLRSRAYDKILRLGVRSAEEMSMAGLTQVTMEGIEQLDLYYAVYLPQFFYAMIAPVILFAVCIFLDWRTSLVLLCCVPLIPVSIVAVSKYAKKIFAKYWGKYTSMGDGFLDSVQGLKELKIFRADEARNEKMNEQAEEFRKITMKVLVMQLASTTIMDLIAYGGAGAGICFAVLAALRGGPVAVSLFLILVAVEFFLPLRSLGSAFHVAMNGASAGQKIIRLLETEEPEWGTEEPEGTELSMEHVSFSYDGSRQVLRDVTMSFPAHAMTAVAGESGTGKSTVISLLTGGQRPQSGCVRAGGRPVESLNREGYYRKLSVVSCSTYIFNDTIRGNFLLAAPDVTEEMIWEALRLVNLDRFIRNAGGLDKMVSEDGANISGGQKQRLALAIALAADRDIYIFDEATSNIDVESETIIMDNILRLSGEKTVIMISHRLANVVRADNIYVLSEGKVAQSGSHERLMEQDGVYRTMYQTQKQLEEVDIRA
ncbi:ABC transporter ATP-binding protein/permease [Lacrimispora sp. NSJ-141]|uniref:ABC transporter ATP-binding protein/permease n=1 Tax=Lientehia hominis TaxID=2897778 RepID=A0AAP2W814_9FIRM|nr:ABC transporter ATP-binding protein/permease [Lientehia hominis]MCD2491561.1 ABC transporter ATP-binding protein/permease [Lientehia hominis]